MKYFGISCRRISLQPDINKKNLDISFSNSHINSNVAPRFLLRHELLEQSLTETGILPDLKERWLKYDIGMKKALVKDSISECAGRFKSEAVVVVERPV